jgi:hypothetical protein
MSTSSQDRPDLGGTTKELNVSEIVGVLRNSVRSILMILSMAQINVPPAECERMTRATVAA